MPTQPDDIEISHKLKARNNPIIVKFLSHKVKSNLYKKRVELKNVKVSDLFPTTSYATAIGRDNRLFLNENLTACRRRIVTKANNMRKDDLLSSVRDYGRKGVCGNFTFWNTGKNLQCRGFR